MQELCLVPGRESKTQVAFQMRFWSIFPAPGKAQMSSAIWLQWSLVEQNIPTSLVSLTLGTTVHKENETVTSLNAKCSNLSQTYRRALMWHITKSRCCQKLMYGRVKGPQGQRAVLQQKITFLFPVLIGVRSSYELLSCQIFFKVFFLKKSFL